MLISLNWLKKYVDINVPTNELIDLIGARLVEIEDVIDQTKKYDNIFVVEVVECEKIPETHLSLCKISCPSKSDALIQVVCGAPNVRQGMLAAWIAPGATVPASVHEDAPFIIGARKLRGYDSNGMLAGADELDFGDEHGGIVELNPAAARPGQPLAEVFDLNDTLLDVENKPLTRRPDTFGIIGFAREIAGILGQKFKTPDFLLDNTADFVIGEPENLKITIKDPALCPRYTALIMTLKSDAKPSKYLTYEQTLLSRSGMRPIDPIVDATNYLMLLTGQPLHAFDYDKLIAVGKTKNPEIIVRPAKAGEKLELLDGKTVTCVNSDILITSNNIPVALAGAMGGKSTAIDENTKKVIVESATFSLYNLRKTQMEHGIFSEAITRFTKGQPAGNTLPVAKEFATLMATQMKPLALIDEYPHPAQPTVVTFTTQEINDILGSNYDKDKIIRTLENVNFTTSVAGAEATGKRDFGDCLQSRRSLSDSARNDGPEERVSKATLPVAAAQLSVMVPYWRTDIHIKEDITEEVGRLLGFDNIEPTTPNHQTATKNPLFTLKSQIRNILSAAGANELLTYSFVSERLINNATQDPKNSYKITNSLSPDLQFIRQQITPSLLEKAYDNLKDGFDEFTLFEMNQIFIKDGPKDKDGVPEPGHNLALVYASKTEQNPYYKAKKHLLAIMKQLGIEVTLKPASTLKKFENFYEPKRSASIFIDKEPLGVIGEIKRSVAHNFKLPATAAFELDLEVILRHAKATSKAPQISKYPSVERDLTLKVSTPFEVTANAIQKILSGQKLIFTLTPTSIYQAENATTKNLSFHLEFSHPDETLTSAKINQIMQSLEAISEK